MTTKSARVGRCARLTGPNVVKPRSIPLAVVGLIRGRRNPRLRQPWRDGEHPEDELDRVSGDVPRENTFRRELGGLPVLSYAAPTITASVLIPPYPALAQQRP